MYRFLLPPRLVFVSVIIGTVLLLAGCTRVQDMVHIAGVGDPPCLTTTTRATAVLQSGSMVGDTQAAGAHTPCLTAASAPGARSQTIRDAAGDVRGVVAGAGPVAGLGTLGDITAVCLTVTDIEVILKIETAGPVARATPAGIDSVSYTLDLFINDPVSGGEIDYAFSAVQTGGRWIMLESEWRPDTAATRQVLLDASPFVSESAICFAAPLGDMPDFRPRFTWLVESGWTWQGTAYSDVSSVNSFVE